MHTINENRLSVKNSGAMTFRLNLLVTEKRDKQIDEILEIFAIESEKEK